MRSRIVLDADRLIVVQPDWLLRGGARQRIEVFSLDECCVTVENERTVVHQYRPPRTFQIPATLHDGAVLAAYLRGRVFTANGENADAIALESSLAKGIEVHYGSPSGNVVYGLAVLAAYALGHGLAARDWSSDSLFKIDGSHVVVGVTALGSLLLYALGPKIRFDSTGVSHHWLGRVVTIKYGDVRRCYFEERWSLQRVVIESDDRKIAFLAGFIKEVHRVTAILKRKSAEAWPVRSFPYTLQPRTRDSQATAAIYVLAALVSAGVGLIIYAIVSKGLGPILLLSVAIGWALVSAYFWWRSRNGALDYVFDEETIAWRSNRARRTYPVAALEEIRYSGSFLEQSFTFQFERPHKKIVIAASALRVPSLEFLDALRTLYPHISILTDGKKSDPSPNWLGEFEGAKD